jgi:hypothetical protein
MAQFLPGECCFEPPRKEASALKFAGVRHSSAPTQWDDLRFASLSVVPLAGTSFGTHGWVLRVLRGSGLLRIHDSL